MAGSFSIHSWLAILESGLNLRGEGPHDAKTPNDVSLADISEPGGTGGLGEVAAKLLDSAGILEAKRSYSPPGGWCGFGAALSATDYQTEGQLLSSLTMQQQQVVIKDFVEKEYAKADPDWVSRTLTAVFPDIDHAKFKVRPQQSVSLCRAHLHFNIRYVEFPHGARGHDFHGRLRSRCQYLRPRCEH